MSQDTDTKQLLRVLFTSLLLKTTFCSIYEFIADTSIKLWVG